MEQNTFTDTVEKNPTQPHPTTIADIENSFKKKGPENGNLDEQQESLNEYSHEILGEHPNNITVLRTPRNKRIDPEDKYTPAIENVKYLVFVRDPQTNEKVAYVLNFQLFVPPYSKTPLNSDGLEDFKSLLNTKDQEKKSKCNLFWEDSMTMIFPGSKKPMHKPKLNGNKPDSERYVSLYKPEQEEVEQLLELNKKEGNKTTSDETTAEVETDTEKQETSEKFLGEEYAKNETFYIPSKRVKWEGSTYFLIIKNTDPNSEEGGKEEVRILQIDDDKKADRLEKHLKSSQDQEDIGLDALIKIGDTEILHLGRVSNAEDPEKPGLDNFIPLNARKDSMVYMGEEYNPEIAKLLKQANGLLKK